MSRNEKKTSCNGHCHLLLDLVRQVGSKLRLSWGSKILRTDLPRAIPTDILTSHSRLIMLCRINMIYSAYLDLSALVPLCSLKINIKKTNSVWLYGIRKKSHTPKKKMAQGSSNLRDSWEETQKVEEKQIEKKWKNRYGQIPRSEG